MSQAPHTPTCTAILANYNHAAFLGQALDMALGQTVPFDEIIIIDDASTDDSVAIIEQRIATAANAKLIRNPTNIGVVASLNLGVEQATGDFVYFMSADDSYSLRIMEWCRPAMEQFPDIGMVCGNITIQDATTGAARHFALPFAPSLTAYQPQDVCAIARKRNFTFLGGGNIIRRQAILDANKQLPALKWNSDWFLYLVIGLRHPFAFVPQTFVQIRQSNSQYSHGMFAWQTQRPIIETFIQTLRHDYPREYSLFRQCALLPSYDLQALPLLLSDTRLRHYLTPLLAWRLLTYKPLRVIGRLLPDDLRARIRQLLHV